jgi:hypothetical protein
MRFPFSDPPPKPDKPNWWFTLPGLLSILVITVGALMIIGRLVSGD